MALKSLVGLRWWLEGMLVKARKIFYFCLASPLIFLIERLQIDIWLISMGLVILVNFLKYWNFMLKVLWFVSVGCLLCLVCKFRKPIRNANIPIRGDSCLDMFPSFCLCLCFPAWKRDSLCYSDMLFACNWNFVDVANPNCHSLIFSKT